MRCKVFDKVTHLARIRVPLLLCPQSGAALKAEKHLPYFIFIGVVDLYYVEGVCVKTDPEIAG